MVSIRKKGGLITKEKTFTIADKEKFFYTIYK